MNPRRRVYLTLLHFPVTNRQDKVVTTSVTNMDIHDISRSARTYGLNGYFLVTPLEDQRETVGRILEHWRTEQSRQYHPDRFDALSLAQVVPDFGQVLQAIERECGEAPEVVLTDARPLPQSVSYSAYRAELEDPARPQKPVCLVFGTGWGVAPEFYPAVNRILAPVYGPEGPGGYNHLSVRAAVAIILDRLLGQ